MRKRFPLTPYTPTRRRVLRDSLITMGVLATGRTLAACRAAAEAVAPQFVSNIANLGAIGDPDSNGVRLPPGFTSRIVARTGQKPVASSDYLWHPAPDGGACFATDDGGWIYVSNSEVPLIGGVGALRFDATGTIVDAYPILARTHSNCAGGITPWGTWLSCEEIPEGRVWECDPTGTNEAIVWEALGVFKHEAVAVDPIGLQLYMTEDEEDGRFYRFTPDNLTPDGWPDLSKGTLEVMDVLDQVPSKVRWLKIEEPRGIDAGTPTRYQQPTSTAFKGGEGIWYSSGRIFFSTKGDSRIWKYDIATETLSVIYDPQKAAQPHLRGSDNITMLGDDVLVAEDNGDLQIVTVNEAGMVKPVVQLVGHDNSELAGPAFSPDGTRLYFSSQRGTSGDMFSGGITFEIRGPWHVPI